MNIPFNLHALHFEGYAESATSLFDSPRAIKLMMLRSRVLSNPLSPM